MAAHLLGESIRKMTMYLPEAILALGLLIYLLVALLKPEWF
jgi:K+-transporting ATPase KdpF subunit